MSTGITHQTGQKRKRGADQEAPLRIQVLQSHLSEASRLAIFQELRCNDSDKYVAWVRSTYTHVVDALSGERLDIMLQCVKTLLACTDHASVQPQLICNALVACTCIHGCLGHRRRNNLH